MARAESWKQLRHKIAARLTSLGQIDQLNVKNLGLLKAKDKLTAELDDLLVMVERAEAQALAAEKRQKQFRQDHQRRKVKVDDLLLNSTSQKECRYSTELFRVKAAYDENLDQLDGVRRENKNSADEIKDPHGPDR